MTLALPGGPLHPHWSSHPQATCHGAGLPHEPLKTLGRSLGNAAALRVLRSSGSLAGTHTARHGPVHACVHTPPTRERGGDPEAVIQRGTWVWRCRGRTHLGLWTFPMLASQTAAPCPRRGTLSPDPEPGKVLLTSMSLSWCRGVNGSPTRETPTQNLRRWPYWRKGLCRR